MFYINCEGHGTKKEKAQFSWWCIERSIVDVITIKASILFVSYLCFFLLCRKHSSSMLSSLLSASTLGTQCGEDKFPSIIHTSQEPREEDQKSLKFYCAFCYERKTLHLFIFIYVLQPSLFSWIISKKSEKYKVGSKIYYAALTLIFNANEQRIFLFFILMTHSAIFRVLCCPIKFQHF